MDNNSQGVLVVDDALVTRLAVAESLEGMGKRFTIDAAESVGAVLDRKQPDGFVLTLVDLRLLGSNRAETVAALRNWAPGAQLFLTGDFFDAKLGDAASELGMDGFVHKPFTLEHMREIVERAADPTGTEDATPRSLPSRASTRRPAEEGPDPRKAVPSITAILERLLQATEARGVVLMTVEGHAVASVGQLRGLHVPTLAALIAANFSAAAELSRQLGNKSEFRASHHTGPDSSIYTYGVDADLLLAVVFDAQSASGAVWLYARRAAADLAGILPLASSQLAGSGLADAVETGFDELFEASDPT